MTPSPHIKSNGLDEIAARSDLTRIVVFYRQEGDHQRYVEYHPDTLRQLVEQYENLKEQLDGTGKAAVREARRSADFLARAENAERKWAVERDRANGLLEQLGAAMDVLNYAWTIICNVSEGDWTKQQQDWQDAAARCREQYHALLDSSPAAPEVPL